MKEHKPASLFGRLPGWMTQEVCAFFGAMGMGLIAQGMGLFNKFSWHDDIFSLFQTGATITSGRWMLHVLAELEILVFGDGHFSLPLMNGLISLLCIGLSAALIVSILGLRSRRLSALLGGLMAAFPVVTALFGFMFTVHYYMIGLLMLVAGARLILGPFSWPKRGLGIVLCGCSVGIYQAFLPLLPALALLSGLADLSRREEKLSAFWKRLLFQALCIAGVMIVYTAVSRFFLWKEQLEMDSYMGMDQVGSTSLAVYLARAGRAYREFFAPARNVLWDMYPQHAHYVYLAMLVLDGALGLLTVIQAWQKSKGKALTRALLLALMPLACNFIFVMSEEVHSLMVYGQIAQFALLALLLEQAELRLPKLRRAASGLTAGVMLLGCVMYARFDNQCYLKAAFQQQEAISWYTALVTRIKSAEGYRDELPVAWVNRMDMQDESLYNIDELNFIFLASYEQEEQGYINNWAWERYLARWCGFAPQTVEPETVENLPEVQTMPHYPDDGSIQVLNDVIVVNF